MTLVGFFHDIATPCFSHVIDYMNQDYENQESTEEYTEEILRKDGYLQKCLKEDNIDIDDIFNGGIYSCQEHLMKLDKNIYELIIQRFNLKKEETIFFDDKNKNVVSIINCGINSFVFNSIDDIINLLTEKL